MADRKSGVIQQLAFILGCGLSLSGANAGTMQCAQHADATSRIYATTVEAHISNRRALANKSVSVSATAAVRGLWQETVDAALKQADDCLDPSDIVVRSEGYATAAVASYALGYLAEARRHAESCIKHHMLRSECYLTLYEALFDAGERKKADQILDEGLRVAKLVKEQGSIALFDLTRKLSLTTQPTEQTVLTNQIKTLRAELQNADTTIDNAALYRKRYPKQ